MPREAAGALSLQVPKTRLEGGPGQPDLLSGNQPMAVELELDGL